MRLSIGLLLIGLAPAIGGAQTGAPATRTSRGGVETPSPALVIEAPPELASARSRLESFDLRPLAGIIKIVGLEDAGPPITVLLADEGSAAARRVSPWIAGFASDGHIVLFPARSPRYPHDTLEDVLRHEVAHVLISRAASGRPVPRWFHEGLAVAVERPWGLEDRSRLAWELVAGPRLTMREIDALFEGGQSAQSRAYSLSAAVVRDLIREHGSAAPAGILRLVNADAGFDEAVARVTGRPIGAVEDEFWDRQRVWAVWLPMVMSESVLWLAVIGLAALAVWRRRRGAAEIRRQWAEEERAAAEREVDERNDPP